MYHVCRMEIEATRQKLFALKTRQKVESRLEDDNNVVRTNQDFSECWGSVVVRYESDKKYGSLLLSAIVSKEICYLTSHGNKSLPHYSCSEA